ncbi:protein-serine O-palmitoleoyltransferase porcupine [Planococcus citri]|uniref:protein-serine O-palmitoleoyltransferase porcupine n=1 Tax=Planococcus citri TaxID=170843 RepID=UPI0031F803F0
MIINEMDLGSFDLEEEYDYDLDDGGMYDSHYSYDDQNSYITFAEIIESCAIPTVRDICRSFFPTLALCFAFQLFNYFTPGINVKIKHILSGILGIGILYMYVEHRIIHSIAVAVIFYLTVVGCIKNGIRTSLTSLLLLSYLTICEFTFQRLEWPRIRNVQMLIVMKAVSLTMDYEGKFIREFPSFFEYFGYIFCFGNCIFGPWVDFKSYLEIFVPKRPTRQYVTEVVKSVVLGFAFFVLSMCLIDWLLQRYSQSTWGIMYGKAAEFRSGHYFVMYLSSSLALAAGFESLKGKSDSITKPNMIEFPHSLVEVVVNWNIPMHNWLKRYTFKPLQSYGNFLAVIGTYFVSSLLHGLNYRLSGVLLSLGVYTYVEHTFRRKLSYRMNACISSKSCRLSCDKHRFTGRKLGVCFINLFFTILALYHLSYLGCLIDLRADDNVTFYQAFDRWRGLRYESHYVILITYIVSLFL